MFSIKQKNIKKYNLSRIYFRLLSLLFIFPFHEIQAQIIRQPSPDTLKSDSIAINDTLIQRTDTIIVDSAALAKIKKKPVLEAEVIYSSEDSLIFSISQQKVYLYDQGVVNYQDIGLKGNYIEFDYGSKIAMATGAIDSAGVIVGKPEFTKGEDKYDFDTMRYNFDTHKAIIKSIITQQGEGYLHSTLTKRLANGEIDIKNGKYTTCDLPHPHFYIALTKAISIPGKRTVSGPAYLVFEDIPMPLGLPFGFFPNTDKRASGFVIPEFRDEQRRGFGLENGGWYFAFNDYLDVTILGSIYSRGTWGLKALSQYLVKYKYSGQFSAQFFFNKINDDPDEPRSKDFKINWSHSQDPKANPTRTFRASVDFSTSSFERQQGTSFSNILENQKNSSISYTKRWPGRPFNFAANLNGSQSTRTKTVNLTFPSMTFNMERIYPFRGKKDDGDYNWLENIQISYNSRLINRVNNVPDSLLFTKSTLKKMENGFAHSVPISLANVKLFKFISITPGVSYNGVLFPYYIRKSARTDTSIFRTNEFKIDTIHKITYAQAFSASISVSASPKIYGMFTSTKENSHIIAIRHVLSPSASFSFSPDMKGLVPDYYRQVASSSSAIQPVQYSEYSVYEHQVNPTPTVSGRSGSVSLGLGNNLEMKVRSKNDTTGEGKKVVILDNLDFRTSYSPFAQRNRWSPLAMNARSSFFNRNLQVQVSSTFNPYALDSLGGLTDKYLIKETGKLFRTTSAQLNMGFGLQSKAGDKKKTTTGGTTDLEDKYEGSPEDMEELYDESGGAVSSEYVDFDIPWSVDVNYTWSYSKQSLTKTINSSVRISGDINLTPKWKISLNASYDFIAKEITATNVNIFRDLHCWQMRFSIVPYGRYKSYSFTINAKSSLLHDLKWDKRKSWRDNL